MLLCEGHESSPSPSRPSDRSSHAKSQSDEPSNPKPPPPLPTPRPGSAFQQPVAPEPSISFRPTPELTLLPAVAPGELAPSSVLPMQAPASTYAHMLSPSPSDTVPTLDAYGTDYFFDTEYDEHEVAAVGDAEPDPSVPDVVAPSQSFESRNGMRGYS